MFQDNESDWQFIIKYASLLGYETTMHGTHLHIFDPYKAYGRSSSFHMLSTTKNLGTAATPKPGQIAKFSPSYAQRHADGYYMDSIVAVHQVTGETYDVSTRMLKGITVPPRFNNRIQDSVYSYEQAERVIDVESKSAYDFEASATVSGIPGCVPGGLVMVDSYGGPDSDALWYVKAVHHTLTSGAFVSDLKLVRNIHSELQPCQVTAFRNPPAPKLEDRWITTDRTINAYS
jgi:phage protein D